MSTPRGKTKWSNGKMDIRNYLLKKSNENFASSKKAGMEYQNISQVQPKEHQQTDARPKKSSTNPGRQNESTNHSNLMRTEVNLRDYECPICLNILRPPTLICQNGHFVCSKCKNMVESCPRCYAQFVPINNTDFDDTLRKMPVPCLGSFQGCTAVYTSTLLDIHEQHCPWMKTTVCSDDECNKSVLETQYCSHIKKEHAADILTDISQPVTVNFNDLEEMNRTHKVMFVRENPTGQLFEIHVRKKNGGFQVAAKHSGHFAPGSYKVVYQIGLRQEQSEIPICLTKQLYSAQVRKEVMFDNPHLSIEDAHSPYDIIVVIQKSELLEPAAVQKKRKRQVRKPTKKQNKSQQSPNEMTLKNNSKSSEESEKVIYIG